MTFSPTTHPQSLFPTNTHMFIIIFHANGIDFKMLNDTFARKQLTSRKHCHTYALFPVTLHTTMHTSYE